MNGLNRPKPNWLDKGPFVFFKFYVEARGVQLVVIFQQDGAVPLIAASNSVTSTSRINTDAIMDWSRVVCLRLRGSSRRQIKGIVNSVC